MLLLAILIGVALGSEDVSINIDGKGLHFKSQSKTDVNTKLNIDFQRVDSNGNGFRLEANLDSYTKTSNTTAEAHFCVKFQTLVEYIEIDGVPGYSNNDTVGTQINLGAQSWSFMQQPNQGTVSSPVLVATATSTYVKFTCKVGSDMFNDSGVMVPEGMKIDVDIMNFPYSLGGTARLALVVGFVSLKTKSKVMETDTSQTVQSEKVSVKSSGTGLSDAFFSWSQVVQVTTPASDANVLVGNLELVANDGDDGTDNDHRTLAYSFDVQHPTTIHWDPVVAVGGSGASHLWWSPTLLFVLIILALVRV